MGKEVYHHGCKGILFYSGDEFCFSTEQIHQMGKFSSDRAIMVYAEVRCIIILIPVAERSPQEYWNIEPVPIPEMTA